ncbi:hypothetical protein K8353_50120, partial [Burkholderia contaminans]|nr:hypothetical protein [Burkholderia contaminans]
MSFGDRRGEIDIELIVLDLIDFDVILDMDLLTKFQATIDYKERKVVIRLNNGKP